MKMSDDDNCCFSLLLRLYSPRRNESTCLQLALRLNSKKKEKDEENPSANNNSVVWPLA